ncbi:MAG: Wzt carbohydrate-binding domain-containing protein, partial [Sedimentisphaerales bacterium]|nr:Wzt carbohydrate-binding domain-containing protein [Sedimentisphaerales bacterium]
DVSEEGRTVLFVSHNMGAIRQLCSSAILLMGGELALVGSREQVIEAYLSAIQSPKNNLNRPLAINEKFEIELESFGLLNSSLKTVNALQCGQDGSIEMVLRSNKDYKNCLIAITIDTLDNIRVCALHNIFTSTEIRICQSKTIIRCELKRVPLTPGTYKVNVKIKVLEDVIFFLEGIFSFDVEDGDFFRTGRIPDRSWGGVLLVEHSWNSIHVE